MGKTIMHVFQLNEDNAQWVTCDTIICDLCGRKTDKAIEVKHPETGESWIYCFNERECAHNGFSLVFSLYPDIEYFYCRGIERLKKHQKRESIGLSLRYDVLKRDKFKCALCGAQADEEKLEIDHIKPVSKNGKNSLDNLRTLCFKCNRGKGDKFGRQ